LERVFSFIGPIKVSIFPKITNFPGNLRTMKPDLLVIIPEPASRLEYVFGWMAGVLGFGKVKLSTTVTDADSWPGACLHYCSSASAKAYWLPLGPTTWYRINKPGMPEVQRMDELVLLYPLAVAHSLPMDLPAAIFWLLSRAEEYDQPASDGHGRFPASASLAWREGFLERPLIDGWLSRLRRELLQEWPGLGLPQPESRVIPTCDVDFAWRYRHKPLLRQLRTLAGEAWRNGLQGAWRGLQVMTGARRDPYDLYALWEELDALLFFPLGDPGPFDRQHSWQEPHYRALVRRWTDRQRAGLHPSYASATDPGKLQEEIVRFTDITGVGPVHSRQHFLRFRLPDTYRALAEAGIREEWSMGYADAPGFRAGTAHPFPWYDLEADAPTAMQIHPLAVMDVTLNRYQKLSPEEAGRRMRDLREATREGGGELVTLWHHPSVACLDPDWLGWEALHRHLR
jgi:hypothetical protein